ncbi:MAG TPA: hypothetical protein VHL80_14010 [Polyangia bacterium]|nr:hypothetical protein [Polyangia bacterium]
MKGDAAFEAPPGQDTFVTCQATSPTVAFVEFDPPADALPGATFDAVATVHAADGSFADGTVKLHGEVTTPAVTVDKASVDFGTVGLGDAPAIPLQFTAENGSGLSLAPQEGYGNGSFTRPPFVVTLMSADGIANTSTFVWKWVVTVETSVPGDYSATIDWQAVLPARMTTPPPQCSWTTTTALHARVVGDGDAGADAADASDGGQRPASSGSR